MTKFYIPEMEWTLKTRNTVKIKFEINSHLQNTLQTKWGHKIRLRYKCNVCLKPSLKRDKDV